MSLPSFTIAIPTHNRRDTVLLAVRSALAQEHAPEQVVVLCDGCSDGTAEAVAALGDDRVLALELEKGPGYAYDHRNRVLDRAATEFLVYLADDDLLLPGHLAQVARRAPDADIVCTPAVVVAPDDSLEWVGADWSVPEARDRVLTTSNSNPMASVAVRAAAAQGAGGWDGQVSRAGDWDLWQRMLRAGARACAADEATVLHFRATGRVQDWDDRVAQNGRWLDRIADPQQLAELRTELQAARYASEARLLQETDELRRLLHERSDELTEFHRVHAEQHAALEAVAAERLEWITRSEALLDSHRQALASAERELAALRAQR